MPLNAIATGAVDGVYPAQELYGAISRWLKQPKVNSGAADLPRDEREAGVPSVFTCPDCGGTLWELDQGSVLRFRCRTGHAYSGHSMLASHEAKLEGALWASIRALEERRDLLRRLAARSRQSGEPASTHRFERRSAEVQADLDRLRGALENLLTASGPT
jgi:two-component system, chemotaxis family, protein-glutamate methylesterase/glutaminase